MSKYGIIDLDKLQMVETFLKDVSKQANSVDRIVSDAMLSNIANIRKGVLLSPEDTEAKFKEVWEQGKLAFTAVQSEMTANDKEYMNQQLWAITKKTKL